MKLLFKPASFLQLIVSVLFTFGFSPEAVADKSQCSDVLRDGTKALKLFNESSAYRRLLETKLINMTSQQARADTSFTGNIPIGDVILGVGFTDKSFDDYKSYLQKNTSLFIEATHALDVLLSTGDPEILAA